MNNRHKDLQRALIPGGTMRTTAAQSSNSKDAQGGR